MHPLLQTRRRLALYLLAWTPLAALLGVIVWASGTEPPLSLALELAPACGFLAFLCLSPWYICRARPLRISAAAGLLATFLTAAAVAALLLVAVARIVALLLDRSGPPLGAL